MLHVRETSLSGGLGFNLYHLEFSVQCIANCGLVDRKTIMI